MGSNWRREVGQRHKEASDLISFILASKFTERDSRFSDQSASEYSWQFINLWWNEWWISSVINSKEGECYPNSITQMRSTFKDDVVISDISQEGILKNFTERSICSLLGVHFFYKSHSSSRDSGRGLQISWYGMILTTGSLNIWYNMENKLKTWRLILYLKNDWLILLDESKVYDFSCIVMLRILDMLLYSTRFLISLTYYSFEVNASH